MNHKYDPSSDPTDIHKKNLRRDLANSNIH